MFRREVEFNGDETCQNCGEELNTEEGGTAWKESPELILVCQQCEDSYDATINRDVLILEQA